MPVKFDLGDDDGYMEVAVPGGSVTLDLYEANNQYLTLSDEHADPVPLADAWAAWLAGKGLPPLSHRAAFRLADAVLAEVARLKKSDGGDSASADSSASTAEPSTPDCPAPAPSAA